MKKRFIASIVMFILAMIVSSETRVKANIQEFIAISVNDRLLSFEDVSPYIEQGTTYVPLRIFAESMGVQVQWDGKLQEVRLAKGDRELVLQVNKQQFVTNMGKTSAYSMKKTNDRIVVPYRFVAEYFGFSVYFDQTYSLARVIDSEASLTQEQFINHFQAELIQLRQQHVQDNRVKKYAYLTFDDGPNQYTTRILEVLETYDSKATFFMMEGNISRFQGEVASMVDAGHSVGCHGVTHEKAKFYRSPSAAHEEMKQCLTKLNQVSDSASVLIRVPYGSKPYMTEPYRKKMIESGYKMWDWNIDSEDWKIKDGNDMFNHVKKQLKQMEKQGVAPVILFHEQKRTLEQLGEILAYLKDEGYELRPLTAEMTPYDFWNRKVDSLRK